MNNDQHLAGSSNIPFVHLRAAWFYGQVSQSHESCGRSIIIWRRWFRSQRALGTGNGMRWTGLRYPDDIWPSRNPKTKRIPNCCEHLCTFELLGHCIKLPQPFGYGIVWLKMIEPQNWTLGWRLKLDKIGRLLWLHWYSKLFRQTLRISFRFPSENTETPIFKRLVCRMGYANFRHVSCWNSQCLWVYIVIVFNHTELPILVAGLPSFSIIVHYLPLFAIFHCLPSSLSFMLPIIPVAKNTFSEGFWCFIDCNGHFLPCFLLIFPQITGDLSGEIWTGCHQRGRWRWFCAQCHWEWRSIAGLETQNCWNMVVSYKEKCNQFMRNI